VSTNRGPFRPSVSAALVVDRLAQALALALPLDDYFKTPESRAAVEQIRAAMVAVGELVK
jgi:hypothetical protein